MQYSCYYSDVSLYFINIVDINGIGYMSKSESSHWLLSLDPLLRQSLEQSIVNKEEGIIIQNTIVVVG